MREFLIRFLPYLGSNLLTAVLCVYLTRREQRRIRSNGDWLRSLDDAMLGCLLICPQDMDPHWRCEDYKDCVQCTEQWLKEERTCLYR